MLFIELTTIICISTYKDVQFNCIGFVIVLSLLECVVGSSPGGVKLKTIKLIVAAVELRTGQEQILVGRALG